MSCVSKSFCTINFQNRLILLDAALATFFLSASPPLKGENERQQGVGCRRGVCDRKTELKMKPRTQQNTLYSVLG